MSKRAKEVVVEVLAIAMFFGVCIAGNLLIDRYITDPLVDKYTTHNDYAYAVDAEVVEHTDNGNTLLEDSRGWLWMMGGQEIEVGTVGVLVLDNMDTPNEVYDDEIIDFR